MFQNFFFQISLFFKHYCLDFKHLIWSILASKFSVVSEGELVKTHIIRRCNKGHLLHTFNKVYSHIGCIQGFRGMLDGAEKALAFTLINRRKFAFLFSFKLGQGFSKSFSLGFLVYNFNRLFLPIKMYNLYFL